jgi:hypothetical protein
MKNVRHLLLTVCAAPPTDSPLLCSSISCASNYANPHTGLDGPGKRNLLKALHQIIMDVFL